jgi:hypothetical protein
VFRFPLGISVFGFFSPGIGRASLNEGVINCLREKSENPSRVM